MALTTSTAHRARQRRRSPTRHRPRAARSSPGRPLDATSPRPLRHGGDEVDVHARATARRAGRCGTSRSCATATGEPERARHAHARHLGAQGRRVPARPPGAPRRADRPAEPHALQRATSPRRCGRRRRRGAVRRPRRVQGRQRLARPLRRRRAAHHRRRAPAPARCAPATSIARFGGDEFAILLPGVDDEDVARSRVADRIADGAATRRSRSRARSATSPRASACAAPTAATLTPEEMLRDADAAMYRAKELGKDRWERFDTALRAEVAAAHGARERPATRRRARRAPARTTSRRSTCAPAAITGTEALLRWDHPRLGAHPAADVHPDRGAQRAHRPDRRLGPARGLRPGAARGRGTGDGRQRVAPPARRPRASPTSSPAILRETGLEPQRLCLEVTESTLIADPENARRALLASSSSASGSRSTTSASDSPRSASCGRSSRSTP